MLETLMKVQPWPFTVETARLCRSSLVRELSRVDRARRKCSCAICLCLARAHARSTTHYTARAARDQLVDHVTARLKRAGDIF